MPAQQAFSEIAHAALIGKPGPDQGKIVLWRTANPGQMWLWDPASPSGVSFAGPVDDTTGRIVDDNLFCSGHCQDGSGSLVIGGGVLNQHLNPAPFACPPVNGCSVEPNWTYLFDAAAAGTSRWARKQDMLYFATAQDCDAASPMPCTAGHYYPSLVTLPSGQVISAGATTSPGGGICARSGLCRSNESQVFDGTGWTSVGPGPLTGGLPRLVTMAQLGAGPGNAWSFGFHHYPILHVLASGWLFASVVPSGGFHGNLAWSPSALMDIRPNAVSSWGWLMQHHANRLTRPTSVAMDTTVHLHYTSALIAPYTVHEPFGQPVVQSLWSRAHPTEPFAVDEILVVGGHDQQPATAPTHSQDALDHVWRIRDPHLSLTSQFDPVNPGTAWELWSTDLAGGGAPTGLNYKRKYGNVVLLPNCTAVAIGGSANEFGPYQSCTPPAGQLPESDAIPEYHPEILDFLEPAPTGGQPVWEPYPRQGHPRLYHSLAVLLADGRVASIGGYRNTINGVGSCTTLPPSQQLAHTDVEIFKPPYLTLGGVLRPTIVTDVSSVRYGVPLTLRIAIGDQSNPADDIDFVTLMRCGSVTHHVDWDQRCIRLEIVSRTANEITLARLPTVANRGNFVAPPGYYMLFVVRKPAGNAMVRMPSIARFVQVH